jgi:hypothetical protein
MNVNNLLLILFGLYWVLKASLSLYLLAKKRLLPLIHYPLVLLVHVVLVVHGLHTLFIQLPKVLTKVSRSVLGKDRCLPYQ